MVLTLHRYVLRQLVGTILMCWAAMTVLVTMGGGVANLFRGEGFGAIELAKLFILSSPIAATMVLPVAAMFGAAITFGRMSADNEITACRAAGLNIHRLFWSVIGIGMIVSAVTYYSWNFLIPDFIKQAEGLTERDIGRWAASELQKHRTLRLSSYRLHADAAQMLDPDPTTPDVHEIQLRGVAFLELAHRTDVITYGTSREATVTISQSRRQRPVVAAEFRHARMYKPKGQYSDAALFSIPPQEIPRTMRERLGLLSLPTLMKYENAPSHIAEVADQIAKMRRDLANIVTADAVAQALGSRSHRFALTDPDVSIEITSYVPVQRDPQGAALLGKALVRVTEQRRSSSGSAESVNTWYQAQAGRVGAGVRAPAMGRPISSSERREPIVEIKLTDAVQTDRAPDDHPQTELKKRDVSLPTAPLPAAARKLVDEFMDDQLLDAPAALPVADLSASPRPEYLRKLLKDRDELIEKAESRLSQVICLIHFRSAVAFSGLVLVALAAMLGLIFRGSHVLTAFGLSCVPALFVFLSIMAGRNIVKSPATVPIGLGIMWGVCGLLMLGTLLVGAKGVRR